MSKVKRARPDKCSFQAGPDSEGQHVPRRPHSLLAAPPLTRRSGDTDRQTVTPDMTVGKVFLSTVESFRTLEIRAELLPEMLDASTTGTAAP